MPASPVVTRAARECGVIMTAGQAPMKDAIIRIGHMGWVDWADLAAGLHALARALPRPPEAPYLEPALEAWHAVMAEA